MEIVFVYQDNLEITPLQFIGQLYSAEATPYDDYAFLICFCDVEAHDVLCYVL